LNLIRFILAVFVIYSHSFPLSLGNGVSDPFRDWIGVSLGDLAVDCFFTLSGFLITKSFICRRSTAAYAIARCSRIFPALFVVILFCVVPIGLAQTNLPAGEYLTDKLTRNFALKNATLILRGVQFELPGVFNDVPYPKIVNGSLWTLPYELWMYISVAVLGHIGAFRHKFTVVIIAATLLAAHMVNAGGDSVYWRSMFRLGAMFYIGSAMQIWSSRVVLSRIGLCLMLILVAFAICFDLNKVTTVLLGSYGVFYLGFKPAGAIRRFNQLGDYSYGMYLFAYPIQQSLAANGESSTATMFITACFLTLPIAILSWHLVEEPTLSFCKQVISRAWPSSRLQVDQPTASKTSASE
jgi:peptidoglycan/LPS O-acetylase OafA/YrhL